MKALVIVDIQNDFCPGGALAVNEGNAVIPIINRIAPQFDVVTATKDWHPADHGSFAETHGKEIGETIELEGIEQILWPVHCVQGSAGAEFHQALDTTLIEKVVFKGTEKNVDSYSTFFDNKRKRSTGLEQILREKAVTDVYLAGLATDYCVKYSALDALSLGFNVYVVTDACRGVELKAGDVERALREISEAGAKLVRSEEL